MIIVGGSYTHSDPNVKAERVKTIAKACVKLMADGKTDVAISPLIYGLSLVEHTKTEDFKLPDTFEFWNSFCLEFVNHSTEFYVLDMEGWDKSNGLANEIAEAKKINIPVYLVDHKTLEHVKVL